MKSTALIFVLFLCFGGTNKAQQHSELNKHFNSFLEFEEDAITAARATTRVKYKMASFHFKEKAKQRFKLHSLDIKSNLDDRFESRATLNSKKTSAEFSIILKKESKNSLYFSIASNDSSINRIQLRLKSNEEEQFWGLGEQYTHFNLKGKKCPVFTEEQGIGRGDPPVSFFAALGGSAGHDFSTYAAIPFVISSSNRAIFLENTSFSAFDFSKKDEIGIEVWDNKVEGRIWIADQPLDLIEAYTEHSGRFPELPEWAYGTWMGLQGGKEKVVNIVNEAKNYGNPVTALWIQDWVGRRKTRFGSQLWWKWRPDEEAYPDFKQFCTDLTDEGTRVLGYVNSFLADEGEMCREAIEKGYLVKTPDGEDYLIKTAGFPAYLVDLTNPEAFEWLKEIIKKNMIDIGLSGWMADYAEWLPWDAVNHSGISSELYHNRYPVDWARLNREAIAESGREGDIVFFTRAGFSYSNQYSTLFWEGDQMVNWGRRDGMTSALTAMLSGGISGIALNHSDIGGYTSFKKGPIKSTRSAEVLYRWIEMEAFSPIFRTHEGLSPEINHQVYSDEETALFFAKFGRLHWQMRHYFKFYVREAAEKGYPIVRPLYLHYPNDEQTHDLKDQFLCGEDLLVAPVLKKKKEQRKVYFPEGEWMHLFTQKTYSKGTYTIDAPVGQPAVFIKKGSPFEDRLSQIFSDFSGE